MEEIGIKIRAVDGGRIDALPSYESDHASGMDLRARVESPVVLKPFQRSLVPTGIAVSIPVGYEAQVRPRSGLAIKSGVTLLNSPGTIDADYRGEVKVILINLGDEDFVISKGDRIAQMIIQQVVRCRWEEVESLDDTARGDGGFGHTG